VKKVKPARRGYSRKRTVGKRKKAPKTKTVAEYVARVPKQARAAFTKLRATIRSAVPPTASEIISYQIPAFKEGRVLVWFAAFSHHCSLFPTNAVIERFADQLQGFTTSKGTVQFPLNKPLPVTLIRKMVKARVAEDKAQR
jgi:uncharacterized protein YdhG (YjbR/CyaY superfamily)